MNSCSCRKWKENSCIRYRGENHLHECHSLNKTNKQTSRMMASGDKLDFPIWAECWGRVWAGEVDLSLPIAGLNPCYEVGKKSGKGKASRCFIMFRPPVSFSGWLKYLAQQIHCCLSDLGLGWPWGCPCQGCATRGCTTWTRQLPPEQSGVKQMLWELAGWQEAEGKADPHFPSPAAPGHNPAPDLAPWLLSHRGSPLKRTCCTGLGMQWDDCGKTRAPAAPSYPLPLPSKCLVGFLQTPLF